MDNELLRFARIAAAVARRAAFPSSRFARPAYAPAALFAALLLRGVAYNVQRLVKLATPA